METRAKCRIIGLTLGKAVINRIVPGLQPLTAEFAYLREDGEMAGMVEKRMEWSQDVWDKLQALQEAMERDMMEATFEVLPNSQSGSDGSEPPQV